LAFACFQFLVVLADQSSSLFTSSFSGIFGLGTTSNLNGGDFLDTVFGGWLSRNPLQNNFSYGMALNSPSNSEGDGGMLHWVLPDASAHSEDVTWKDVQSPTSPDISSVVPDPDWMVMLDSWSIVSGETSASNTSSALAIIEPFYPDIIFPKTAAFMFCKQYS
jgi:hypothetical protein